MALATVDDVAVPLLRALTEAEKAYAQRLLGWAEILITARFPVLQALNPEAVVMVESQAVARVLRNPDGKYQESVAAGEYSSTRDRVGADGLLRITDEEWDLLSPAKTTDNGGAFAVDTAPGGGWSHSLVCALNFGGRYCSCGSELTGNRYPLYEEV